MQEANNLQEFFVFQILVYAKQRILKVYLNYHKKVKRARNKREESKECISPPRCPIVGNVENTKKKKSKEGKEEGRTKNHDLPQGTKVHSKSTNF
jgi:hypothetical protein